jgi:Putative MetA-pathway of phenol degradation
VSYQFTNNPQRPVTIDLRWYHEFEVKNRLEGDSVFLTISVPLSITTKPQPAQDWTRVESPAPSP